MSQMNYEWKRGRFRTLADNEVALEDLPQDDAGDPVKIRMATRRGKGIGILSINRLRDLPSNDHDEVGMIFGKLDDRYPGQLAGMWDIFCKDPYGNNDSNMKRVMEIFHDKVVFHKPVYGVTAGPSDRIISGDGRFCTIQQSDGNLVTYRRNPDGSLGAAVWASGFTG